MAKLDGISKKPIDEEDKKKSMGCWKGWLYAVGIVVALVLIGNAVNAINSALIGAGLLPTPTHTPPPGPTSTPRPTRTPTPTPLPTPTFEEWKESAEEIPYRTLLRYAEDNVGKRVYYRGEVVQVIEDEGDFQLRVNVTPGEYGFWEDTVFLRHADAPVRILEDDIIAFVGRMNGTLTYESAMGGNVTIPDITVLSLIIESE